MEWGISVCLPKMIFGFCHNSKSKIRKKRRDSLRASDSLFCEQKKARRFESPTKSQPLGFSFFRKMKFFGRGGIPPVISRFCKQNNASLLRIRGKANRLALLNDGRGGIRTPGPLRVFCFQDRRDRPLCHSSIKREIIKSISNKIKCLGEYLILEEKRLEFKITV